MQKSAIDIVGAIVAELSPLSSDERQRVLQAALALLGEKPIAPEKQLADEDRSARSPTDGSSFAPRARIWMRQHQISAEQVEEVFHKSEEGLEPIVAEIPGKTNRERVRNAYVLLGVARFLETGDAKFDDKPARLICEKYGFFDGTNHMKYMKDGNEFTGNKEKGWTLTAPGLKRGAALMKEMAASAE